MCQQIDLKTWSVQIVTSQFKNKNKRKYSECQWVKEEKKITNVIVLHIVIFTRYKYKLRQKLLGF